MTKEDLKNYIIDVLGYRDYMLKGWDKETLEGIIDAEGSLAECIEFNTRGEITKNNPDVPAEIFDIEASAEMAMLWRESAGRMK